jgi:hypothetical protein
MNQMLCSDLKLGLNNVSYILFKYNNIRENRATSVFKIWAIFIIFLEFVNGTKESIRISNLFLLLPYIRFVLSWVRGRRGRDRMVVGFTTTCTITAYHH